MAEASFSEEDSSSSIKFYGTSSGIGDEDFTLNSFNSILNEDNKVPSAHFNGILEGPTNNFQQLEDQISESLDHLSTKNDSTSFSDDENDDYWKKARVGNHYQARIPKFICAAQEETIVADECLWDPFKSESDHVEEFLKRLSVLKKLVLPMGTHLRDNEEALYILQQNNHDIETTIQILSNQMSKSDMSVWSEEDCRSFENGLLSFGKNFFLIQKYKLSTRNIGELVQFYYLWKKTERYDLFAHRLRTGKKKYSLNPGISDLMIRYLGGQTGKCASSDVQFVVMDNRKDVVENNTQY